MSVTSTVRRPRLRAARSRRGCGMARKYDTGRDPKTHAAIEQASVSPCTATVPSAGVGAAVRAPRPAKRARRIKLRHRAGSTKYAVPSSGRARIRLSFMFVRNGLSGLGVTRNSSQAHRGRRAVLDRCVGRNFQAGPARWIHHVRSRPSTWQKNSLSKPPIASNTWRGRNRLKLASVAPRRCPPTVRSVPQRSTHLAARVSPPSLRWRRARRAAHHRRHHRGPDRRSRCARAAAPHWRRQPPYRQEPRELAARNHCGGVPSVGRSTSLIQCERLHGGVRSEDAFYGAVCAAVVNDRDLQRWGRDCLQ